MFLFQPLGGYALLEHVRSEDIRLKLGSVVCTVRQIISTRLRWTGHVARMEEGKSKGIRH